MARPMAPTSGVFNPNTEARYTRRSGQSTVTSRVPMPVRRNSSSSAGWMRPAAGFPLSNNVERLKSCSAAGLTVRKLASRSMTTTGLSMAATTDDISASFRLASPCSSAPRMASAAWSAKEATNDR